MKRWLSMPDQENTIWCTMKKIKNIEQLNSERDRLHRQQHSLERDIGRSLREIKKNCRPQNIAKELAWKWLISRLTMRGVSRLLKLFN